MSETFKFRAVKALFTLLAMCSLRVGHAIGYVCGCLWWMRQGGSALMTQANIEKCFPSLNLKQQQALAKASLISTAQTGVEIAQVWLWPCEKSMAHIVQVTNEHLYEEAIASKKGVIIAAPHLGNWEWFGVYLASKTPITTLYQPAKLPELDAWIRQRRGKTVGRTVPTTREGVVELFKALKVGGVLGILPDQEPELSGGVFAPFFGVEALSMTLISKLAQKTGAHVLCGYAKRFPSHQGFEIIFHKVGDDIYSTDMMRSVAALNTSIEQVVRDAPEQYQWEYNRFKKTIEGVEKRAIRREAKGIKESPYLNYKK